LSYDFHKKTIIELSRVTSREIRIWPIVNVKGYRSVFVDRIKDDEDFRQWEIKINRVDYEFFKNATEMMTIKLQQY
jgi:hypothetical protein